MEWGITSLGLWNSEEKDHRWPHWSEDNDVYPVFSELPQPRPLCYSKMLPDNVFSTHHVGEVKFEFTGFEIFVAFLEKSKKVLSCSQNQGWDLLGIRGGFMVAFWRLDSCSGLEMEFLALIWTLSITKVFHQWWPPDLGGGRKVHNTL